MINPTIAPAGTIAVRPERVKADGEPVCTGCCYHSPGGNASIRNPWCKKVSLISCSGNMRIDKSNVIFKVVDK